MQQTKDEILKDHGATLHDEAYQYSCDTSDLRDAMDAYAEQKAVAFAKWMLGETYRYFDTDTNGVVFWDDGVFGGSTSYTTADLFKLFIQQNP